MAIILKSGRYKETKIDSNIIIGVLGNYLELLESLKGEGVYYLSKNIKDRKIIIDKDNLSEYDKLLNIETFLDKKYQDLSHSENRLLEYYVMIKSDAKVMIIDEPYLDLDSKEIKIIERILKKLVKENKTIIMGSMDINIIYSLCKKVLIVQNNELIYDNIKILNNKKNLDKYHLDVPNIVEFVELAKDKNIKIPFSKDIRDLIKDVYRNVSKK